MIERRIIAVTGPAGGGKTSLIERLLEAQSADDLHCVRAVKVARRGKKDGAAGDLARFKRAGANCVSAFEWSEATHPEEFFESEPFLGVQDAILIEGDVPPGVYGDLTVFVFRPPRLPALLRRVPKVSRAQFEREAKLYHAALQRDAALERFALAKIGEFGRLLTATRESRAKLRQAMRSEGPPLFHPGNDKWSLAPGHEAIVTAGAVVINVASAAERKRAETLRAVIERLRTDEAVLKDVRGNRVPKTIAIADLRDPGDLEVKKALRRVRKAWATR